MKDEYLKKRLQKVKKELKKKNCDSFLIENLTDLFYLTGLSMSAGFILINPKGADLVVDGRYYETCQRKSPIPVTLLEGNTLKKLCKTYGLSKLGFDSAQTPYSRFTQLKKLKLKLEPTPSLIKEIRACKDEQEIKLLKRAAKLGSSGYDFVLTQLKEGITEIEVAKKLEIFWLEQGGMGLAFHPIIAFGKNSSMPHYQPGRTKLKKGDPVLIDIGVTKEHYHSDMTRVVFFGQPKPELNEIYTIVKEAQKKALNQCRPGTKIDALDLAARDHIEKMGYGDKFTHSLGHGIGLEVHENPILSNKAPQKDLTLKTGMVVTVEPGIYLPGLGGVRIEDTVHITDNGHQNLTNRSKDIIFI